MSHADTVRTLVLVVKGVPFRHTGAGRYPGAGGGFRPAPERRGGPSVIPAQAGIHGAGDGFRPAPERRGGGRSSYRRRPVSRGPGDGFRPPPERRGGPSVIPAQAGIQGWGWVPASAGTTRGAVRHTGAGRYPGGVRDGFRPPPERRGETPERRGGRPSYRRRPVSRGGEGWVPACAGTTRGAAGTTAA